jgi:hypothetical protein
MWRNWPTFPLSGRAISLASTLVYFYSTLWIHLLHQNADDLVELIIFGGNIPQESSAWYLAKLVLLRLHAYVFTAQMFVLSMVSNLNLRMLDRLQGYKVHAKFSKNGKIILKWILENREEGKRFD